MTEELIVLWLLVMSVTQVAWCLFYATAFDWRGTPLGPVWLAKGGALAILWPTLLVDQFVNVPDWIFSHLIGPSLFVATLSWLVVTVRVRLTRGEQPRP